LLLQLWPEIGRKYRPIHRFPANVPIANHLKTNLRLLFLGHGMEEVGGSTPTRSTIQTFLESITSKAAELSERKPAAFPHSNMTSHASGELLEGPNLPVHKT
jgi:hypothetical protein